MAVGVGAGGIATSQGSSGEEASGNSARPVPGGTIKLAKGDLAQSVTAPGNLHFGCLFTVGGGVKGTLTWLPKPGDLIERGKPLYRVDDKIVVAFFGGIPVYRNLKAGDQGRDVGQLKENLRELGYVAGSGDIFDAGTVAALRRWQRTAGLEVTGELAQSQFVFVAGPSRVAEVKGQLGKPVGGDVLVVSSRSMEVDLEVPINEQALAHVGAPAEVSLPGGKKVKGEVAASSPAGAAPPSDEQGLGGGGQKLAPTLKVRVKLLDADAAKDLVGGTVDVKLFNPPIQGVFSVPVTALLARPGGGHAIEVVEGGKRRLLPVKTTLFSEGRVQIEGDELRTGMDVAVPG
ncbi:peptidoglycan-binding protein [Streptomyces sp. NPDC098789]|uniref:peptidoglycan-binding protein n=1 Tax=Streptomyces sp. NPDC098789 TaxID=3366098 RepID=UPI0037F689BB